MWRDQLFVPPRVDTAFRLSGPEGQTPLLPGSTAATCTYIMQKGQLLGLFRHTGESLSFVYRKSQKIGPRPEVSDTGGVSLGNPAIICITDPPSFMG